MAALELLGLVLLRLAGVLAGSGHGAVSAAGTATAGAALATFATALGVASRGVLIFIGVGGFTGLSASANLNGAIWGGIMELHTHFAMLYELIVGERDQEGLGAL